MRRQPPSAGRGTCEFMWMSFRADFICSLNHRPRCFLVRNPLVRASPFKGKRRACPCRCCACGLPSERRFPVPVHLVVAQADLSLERQNGWALKSLLLSCPHFSLTQLVNVKPCHWSQLMMAQWVRQSASCPPSESLLSSRAGA